MLEHDPSIREEETWQDFSEKGLCPGINSLDDYRYQLTRNYVKLSVHGPHPDNFKLPPTTLKAIHRTLFGEIYPFAGNFRDKHVFCRGRAGADPNQIQMELDLLQQQTELMIAEATHPRAIARIAAFQHVRLTNIQAFADGNSRTSRAVTERFLSDFFQSNRVGAIDRKEYFKALESALAEENLAQLTNIFLKMFGQSPDKAKWVPSPFQTTNLPTGTDALRALTQSFRQHPEELNSAIPTKGLTLLRWSWDDVAKTVGGKPTSTADGCKELWDKASKEPMTWEQTKSLIDKIEKQTPFAKPLFGETPNWNKLRGSISPPPGHMEQTKSSKEKPLEFSSL